MIQYCLSFSCLWFIQTLSVFHGKSTFLNPASAPSYEAPASPAPSYEEPAPSYEAPAPAVSQGNVYYYYYPVAAHPVNPPAPSYKARALELHSEPHSPLYG